MSSTATKGAVGTVAATVVAGVLVAIFTGNFHPFGSPKTTTSTTASTSTTTPLVPTVSTTKVGSTTTTIAPKTSAQGDLLTATDIQAHAVAPPQSYSHSNVGWGDLVSFGSSSSSSNSPGLCEAAAPGSVVPPSLESEIDYQYFHDGYETNLYREFGSAISQFPTTAAASTDFAVIDNNSCGYAQRSEMIGDQTVAMSTNVPSIQASSFIDRVFIRMSNAIIQVIVQTDEPNHTAIADQLALIVYQRWQAN